MRVLDLESEVMGGPDSIPTGATFCHWIFFHIVNKASDVSIGIMSTLFNYEETRVTVN